MKENSLIKIDRYDKNIINELEKNSRASFQKIGNAVGLSSENSIYRIERLKKLGFIIRMFAEPNLSKLGLKTYRIYLKVENMSEKEEENLLAYFINHPKAQWYAAFEGEWDYTVRFALENEVKLKEEIDELLSKFGKFIRAKDITITTYQSYLPITYLTETERNPKILYLATHEPKKIDKTDKKILFYLMEDARIKTTKIAEKIKISPDAVQYRIKKLVKEETIAFFTTWFNRRKLGYEYYKVLFWFQYATKEDEKKIINYCEQHSHVVFINRVLGNWDLEVDFDARTSAEIHGFVKDLKNRFGAIIRDHTTLIILKDGIVNPFKQ